MTKIKQMKIASSYHLTATLWALSSCVCKCASCYLMGNQKGNCINWIEVLHLQISNLSKTLIPG